MPHDDPYTRFVTVRAKPPPLTSGDTLHWDGTRAVSRRVECPPVSEPGAHTAVPVPWSPAIAPRASPAVPTRMEVSSPRPSRARSIGLRRLHP